MAAFYPEVSVILPVYNVGEYLDVCMESLKRQTFRDYEALLINDGSTDDSADRCRAWAEKDGRVRFIDKENEGVSETRNLGVRLARGKYLAFVDPDDWLDPAYLEKLHDCLEESGADFAECDLWRYDNRTGKMIYRSCGSRTGRAGGTDCRRYFARSAGGDFLAHISAESAVFSRFSVYQRIFLSPPENAAGFCGTVFRAGIGNRVLYAVIFGTEAADAFRCLCYDRDRHNHCRSAVTDIFFGLLLS